MRRRDFIKLIGSSTATWPLAVMAQQGERIKSPANHKSEDRQGTWLGNPDDFAGITAAAIALAWAISLILAFVFR